MDRDELVGVGAGTGEGSAVTGDGVGRAVGIAGMASRRTSEGAGMGMDADVTRGGTSTMTVLGALRTVIDSANAATSANRADSRNMMIQRGKRFQPITDPPARPVTIQ